MAERIRGGDVAALDEVLALYWEPLVRYAVRMLDGRDAAEDVVQEVFVRLWEGRSSWRLTGSLRAFLYTCAHHRILNEQRSRRVRASWAQRARAEPALEVADAVQALEEQDVMGVAERAFAALPERRREVFRLVRLEGLSYREAAEVLGISTQTVANQVSRALAELRDSLRPMLG